jgi:hypothetical protein
MKPPRELVTIVCLLRENPNFNKIHLGACQAAAFSPRDTMRLWPTIHFPTLSAEQLNFKIDESKIMKNDKLAFYAPGNPEIDSGMLDLYWEKFVIPLIPEAKINIREFTNFEKEMLLNRTSAKEPWKVFEINLTEVLVTEWYIALCCARYPYENPNMIRALFKTDLAGLDFNMCWLMASFFSPFKNHCFTPLTYQYDVEQMIKSGFPIAKAIKKLCESDDSLYHTNKISILYEDLNRDMGLSRMKPVGTKEERDPWFGMDIFKAGQQRRTEMEKYFNFSLGL